MEVEWRGERHPRSPTDSPKLSTMVVSPFISDGYSEYCSIFYRTSLKDAGSEFWKPSGINSVETENFITTSSNIISPRV